MRVRNATAACAITLGLTLAAPAYAQGTLWNQKTVFSFGQPVELPGGTLLAPGKYEFRLADPDASRYAIQVRSEDGAQVLGQFFAAPTRRPNPAEKAEIAFMETPANRPAAVKYWYYPGQKLGREFIYPRSQAMTLARATHQPVLSTASESTDQESMRTSDTEYVGEASAAAERSTPEPVTTTAENTRTQETTSVGTAGRAPESTMARRERLPRAAGNMSLVGLLGLLSLAGGLAMARNSRSRA